MFSWSFSQVVNKQFNCYLATDVSVRKLKKNVIKDLEVFILFSEGKNAHRYSHINKLLLFHKYNSKN